MIHFLTVGYLDARAVNRRQIVSGTALPYEVESLIFEFSGAPELFVFEGTPVEFNRLYVRCVWFGPKRNTTSEKFAIEAHRRFGCVVADIEHGRLVEIDGPVLR